MTTFKVQPNNPEALEGFKKWLDKLSEEGLEILILTDRAGGTTSSPSKKRKYYKTLPFAIASGALTVEGNNNFHLQECKAFAVFAFPPGSINYSDEIKSLADFTEKKTSNP